MQKRQYVAEYACIYGVHNAYMELTTKRNVFIKEVADDFLTYSIWFTALLVYSKTIPIVIKQFSDMVTVITLLTICMK